jgi:hypothetical protein
MDALADVIDVSRVRGALLAHVRAYGPWGIRLHATRGAAFHAVLAGACWLRVEDSAPLEFGAEFGCLTGLAGALSAGCTAKMANAAGVDSAPEPTENAGQAALLPISIGVTVPSAALATSAILPSGVMLIDDGLAPTLIGVPALGVAPVRSSGVTLLS